MVCVISNSAAMDTILILVFILVLLVSYFFLTKPRNLPPSRFTIPYLGTPGLFWRMHGRRPHQVFMDEAKALKSPVFCFGLAHRRFAVINGYDAIHEALVKNGDKCSGRLADIRKYFNIKSPEEGKQT